MSQPVHERPVSNIRLAESDDDLRRCFPTFVQLRTHLTEDGFVAQAKRQRQDRGYRIAMLESGGRVPAVAGFRIHETFFSGLMMYVDDLVTDAEARSGGHGRALLDWLTDQARAAGCKTLELDSGVQRFDAHRFYFRERMSIAGYHFRKPLDEGAASGRPG